jgi:flagellin-like protein
MYKFVWKDEEAVSPVIATILMVAITVVLAGVLVVYMQSYSRPAGDQSISGTFVPANFANPTLGVTVNNGGWSVRVTALSGGRPGLDQMSVTIITDASVNVKSLNGVNNIRADHSSEGPNLNWYMVCNGACSYDEGGLHTPVAGNEANIAGDEFQTVENAWFIYIDHDMDRKLSPNDIVMVFRDTNADGVDDIQSGYAVNFKTESGEVGNGPLT